MITGDASIRSPGNAAEPFHRQRSEPFWAFHTATAESLSARTTRSPRTAGPVPSAPPIDAVQTTAPVAAERACRSPRMVAAYTSPPETATAPETGASSDAVQLTVPVERPAAKTDPPRVPE